MTEKPNSVCTCKIISPRQVADGECLICGKPFEPVAEPAEPTAEGKHEEAKKDVAQDKEENQPRNETTLEAAQTRSSILAISPAPQPVAAYLKACVKEGPDCDCVNVCKFDAQPVAGEGPRMNHRKAVEDWFKLPNHNLGFRHEGCCEDTRIINTGCIFCLVITAMVAYKLESAPKRTPKLEEITRLLYAKAYKPAGSIRYGDALSFESWLEKHTPLFNYQIKQVVAAHEAFMATPASTREAKKSPDSHLGAVRA